MLIANDRESYFFNHFSLFFYLLHLQFKFFGGREKKESEREREEERKGEEKRGKIMLLKREKEREKQLEMK